MTTTETKNPTSCCEDSPNCSTPRFEPRVDILETEHELTLFADMPGVAAEDLDIQFEDGELKILGRCAARPSSESYWIHEYEVGDFERTFRVSEFVDADRITAELKNGVLTVRLPKAEAAKPRRITVTT